MLESSCPAEHPFPADTLLPSRRQHDTRRKTQVYVHREDGGSQRGGELCCWHFRSRSIGGRGFLIERLFCLHSKTSRPGMVSSKLQIPLEQLKNSPDKHSSHDDVLLEFDRDCWDCM
ncbi:UNVERIFIED_CONTAM: hypothetical protein HHA_449450 [Hammondia hammondi]|eukprot:XP_008882126.1 hypothetical protein HHA_449450 [Hammondia hammondi]